MLGDLGGGSPASESSTFHPLGSLLSPCRTAATGLSSHPGRLPGWPDPPRLGERLSVLGTRFPAPPGQAHNSLWSLGSHRVTTASQMWPIWNLLPTQPVRTGLAAAARVLRLSLLTSPGDNVTLPLPSSLSSPLFVLLPLALPSIATFPSRLSPAHLAVYLGASSSLICRVPVPVFASRSLLCLSRPLPFSVSQVLCHLSPREGL